MKKIILFIVLLRIYCFCDVFCYDCNNHNGWGPINYHISSPMRGMKNELQNFVPFTLPRKSTTLTISDSIVNIWNYNPKYFIIDMEILSHELLFNHGISKTETISINIPFYYIGGGFLDSTIEHFHNLLGITNANREIRPKDSLIASMSDINGNSYKMDQNELEGLKTGNINLIYQKNLFQNINSSRSLFINLKIPTSDFLMDEKDDYDVTVSYSFSQKNSSNIFQYFILGMTSFANPNLGPIPLKKYTTSFLYALERPMSKTIRSIIQLQINQKITDVVPKFNENTYILNWGWKIKRKNRIFTFSIIENLLKFDNSPDFGLYFSRSFRFKRKMPDLK